MLFRSAFQATTVNTRDQKPNKPVILNLNPDQINNLLIVTPPKETKESRTSTSANKTALDVNFLDFNFFAFTGLDDAFLAQQSMLDINFLEDSGFLMNMLDLLNSQLLESDKRHRPSAKKAQQRIHDDGGRTDAAELRLHQYRAVLPQ